MKTRTPTRLARPGTKIARATSVRTSPEWSASGEWADVVSSNVDAIRYDKEAEALFVRFWGDRTYSYRDVPSNVAEEMFRCKSMGKFVHYRLIGRYPVLEMTSWYKLPPKPPYPAPQVVSTNVPKPPKPQPTTKPGLWRKALNWVWRW